MLPCKGGDSSDSADEADAPLQDRDDWIALDELPDPPKRRKGYYMEPLGGVALVLAVCVGCVAGTTFACSGLGPGSKPLGMPYSGILQGLVWLWAFIAWFCVLFLLCGRAGEIRRSEDTCLPMPAPVRKRLAKNESLQGMQNIQGDRRDRDNGRGTYCVRCLVWRPPARRGRGRGHHCNTCQRCVTGFDHHCGVFGRCIVRGNMPCFITLIAMLPLGVGTAILAMAFMGVHADADSGSSPTSIFGDEAATTTLPFLTTPLTPSPSFLS